MSEVSLKELKSDLCYVGDFAWRYADNSDNQQLIVNLEAAENRIEAALEAQDAEIARLRSIAQAVSDNGHRALRGHVFDCWYCGIQPFQQFEPGGMIDAGWKHAPNCLVMQAKALLSEVEAGQE